MNKYEKEVQQVFLDDEKETLEKLKKTYKQALDDINQKIEVLMARQDADMQHVIYQTEYQKALKTQVKGILEQLQANEFETISEYLANTYSNGFIGTMYDLAGQGIPLIVPIDQEQVVDAVINQTKLKETLYEELGYDIKTLQKQISAEISRGIATGLSYSAITRNLQNTAKIPQNRAMTIARTEGHRIQCKAALDAQEVAESKGADIVKQWDAALDGDTRPNHRKLDGQLRPVKEPFEVAGYTPMYPGDFGEAGEDCNCRCAILQRAKWALDEEELERLKDRARQHGLMVKVGKDYGHTKAKDFADYKKNYLTATKNMGLSAKVSGNGIPEHEEAKLIKKIDYNKKAVEKELKNFEKNAINESIETACVVTKDGEVYKCFGIEDRVFPDFDLKDKLIGASVSHNHLITETAYSFSQPDLSLFLDYDLDVLRGCDEKYIYEFTRNPRELDEHINIFDITEEDAAHEEMIMKAEKFGIGYRRWKND